MTYALWSLAAVPALIVVFATALFGLNDVQIREAARLVRGRGWIELGLGASFVLMAWMSFTIGAACLLGASVYTWRGCLLMWGVAGVFGLVGRFAPWRNWIKRIAESDGAAAPTP
ncbi:MAG TPA: hypothetical protein VGC24_05520 [Burkholderiaceae bacterium]